MDRFTLEGLISQLGNFEDDIETVLRRLYNDPRNVCDDEIANVLIGIKTLHKLRREETFRVLEHLVEKGDLK
jgi:hypothetical protein